MKFIHHSLLALAVISAASVANAHVDWTRLNDADPTNYAVFHLDETGPFADGAFINVTGSQFAGFSMQVDPTFVDAGTVTSSADVFDNLIVGNAGSIIVNGDVLVVSPSATQVPAPNYRDVSFEFWFKWDAPFTVAQDVRIGARSAAKVVIVRDPVTPANDRFGLSFAHNDFVPAPGWVNSVTSWNDFAAEAPIGDWIHIGVVTDSTGMETTSANAVALAHELYDAGSKAWIYVNGHKFGTAPNDFIDLGNNSDVVGDPGGTLPRGIRAHEGTRFQIDNRAGSIKIDELTFWAVDLTAGDTIPGTNVAVFGDGKGTGVAAVENWSMFD